ncbi:demethylmenaquinone methyltransferase [Aquibacillus koreensis]|uniref:Demethylmenaquinone methyltransferase n=1 Tax=Aquibacillus koreensis TaxID=279446 RepID=A0A9X3WK81_9BACI|nr:demethylmenaquinone methyltransferase [Aquibacillus koreensis]MCT2537388.1 demethylmenaquinone methyltransferase [Aquibacillus koreensis]MDC3418834.1 demethylmenaquinone methyltransferase [Aquibacillus koreensis]
MEHQSKEERVHHVFEKIYNRYDFMNSIISFQMHKMWRKDVMKRMQVKKGDKALDVCCGTGDWSFALANAVGQEGSVTGLDFSQNMLSVGQNKLEEIQLKQLDFIHGNAMELPFEDNSFDFVTIGFGLRNVPDYTQVLREMKRVVKPGGKVVCLETSQPTMFGFRQLYYFYFRFIMPLFGKLFAKSYKEYVWLHESAKDFPGQKQLKQMFESVGLKNVNVKGYSGGVAAMHMGEKPS